MTDQLHELMQVVHSHHHGGCTDPNCLDGVFTDEETATAILARWRLVPVHEHEHDWELAYNEDGPRMFGHIDVCACGHWQEHQHTWPPTPTSYTLGGIPACACGRTDNHGPHED